MEQGKRFKIVWICGLPEEVRLHGCSKTLAPNKRAAWGWVLGHLPPPDSVEMHFICPVRRLADAEIHFEYKGAKWHCFREIRGEQYLLRFPVFFKIKKFVRSLKPDIVQGWGGETGCGWLATLLSSRAIVNVQGILRLYHRLAAMNGQKLGGRWLDSKIRDIVEALSYRRAYLLLTESVLSQDALRKYYGHESVVVYHPLREEFLKNPERRPSSDGNPVFLFLGSLEDRKGPMDALRAFNAMSVKDSALHIVGLGPLRDTLGCFVKENALESRVTFHEGLSAGDIRALMANCDFYILPSYGDTGPTSLKEALAQALYPICYDNTGPKEHVERYKHGALCETGSWRGLVPLMEDACKKRNRYSEAGVVIGTKVRHDLSRESIWPKLLSVYREVLHA